MNKSVGPFRHIRASNTLQSNATPTYLIAILLALVSLVTPAASRAGESVMGALRGTVRAAGPSGQSYRAPRAKVRLSQTSQDSSMSAIADDSGEYKFGSVPAGRYTLEVTLDGFEKVARLITIHAGETTVENVKLEVNSVPADITAQAERVGLNISDAEPAGELEQKTVQTISPVNELFQNALRSLPGVVHGPDGLLNVKGSRASQSRLTVNSTVLTNPYAPEYRKTSPSFGGSHFIEAGASYNTFNGNSSRHFVSARNQTVHLPGFFSLEMQVLKSYGLRVSPKVSLRNHGRRPPFPDVQDFYPRDFRSLASADFGMFSNGVGRMFGMRFVIEKK
ncbi:MAG TPA: carboxypeptidase-like regulatory domain-containing protein [Pyrinomonadaceae bacterium]|nr:carboxypeptidase-like regulatory domain-containing protein [Pyrinomonadaceae bacterium]